jgi:endonuclease/exonuclease/phosphatase family metal-dependent hydrolase
MPDASLTVVTYNTFQERNGRDPALDALLGEKEALICLQEVNPLRAAMVRLALGSRAFVSAAQYGLQYLVLVLPEGASFLERRTASLNGYKAVLPRGWSVRRSYVLHRTGRPTWRDGFEPRVAQSARVLWEDREFRVVNTHLPLDFGLRNRCLDLLRGLLDSERAIVTGDFNTTVQRLFFRDFLVATGLRPAGTEEPTQDRGRRIDFVLYSGGFREVGYSLTRSLSDHRVVRAELEV